MAAIELIHITNHICRKTSLSIRDGELLVLAGATGAGKTTLLNVIAGLCPYKGNVRFGGNSVDGLPPSKRNAGYLFQEFALFPHMTVKENIAFGLHARGRDKGAIAGRVMAMLTLLRVRHLEDRYPKSLSGGEKQRVALARTLAPCPGILLLDEPFSNLDPRTAKFLRLELKRLQQKLELTAVYVTHNQMEAFEMGDRIAVVSRGRVEQVGNPAEILFAPRTPAVSTLFGSPNILACRRIRPLYFGLAKAECGDFSLIVPDSGEPVDKIAVFPSGIHISKYPIDSPAPNRLNGFVENIRLQSPMVYVDMNVHGTGITAELPAHVWDDLALHVSDPVHITIPLKSIRHHMGRP